MSVTHGIALERLAVSNGLFYNGFGKDCTIVCRERGTL